MGMDAIKRWGTLLLVLGASPGCADLEGRDASELDRAVGGIDVADYLLLDCAGPSSANRIGSETMYTIPLGMADGLGRFVIMKSNDGSGFEEWAVDDEWFYIRKDTTWAYQNPANPSEWCDTQCGENGPHNCVQRWAGDHGDWAYTVYHEPGQYDRPARWLPRSLDLEFGDSLQFTTSMAIQAERYSDCGACNTNFSSPAVDRTVRASLHASWNGFSDVLELHVLAGPGTGEHYFYGRGRGWIGFGDRVADPSPVTGTAQPAVTCGGVTPASICGVGGPVDDGGVGEDDGGPADDGGGGGAVLPDMRVNAVWTDPATPQPGDAVRVFAEVQNAGNATTPDIVGVGFSVNGAGAHQWWSIGAPMAPGATATLQMDATWTPTSPGAHSLVAHVDDIDRFAELDEGNNAGQTTVTVGGGAPPPPPPPPPSGADGHCPCLDGTTPSGQPIDNYCLYPADADPDCTMLTPHAGYCDPNGDGSLDDADWVRGYHEYQEHCG